MKKKNKTLVILAIIAVALIASVAYYLTNKPLGAGFPRCDLTRCGYLDVLAVCGEVYKLHGIGEDEWMDCMLAYNQGQKPILGALLASTTDPRVWVYDAYPFDCYISYSETLIVADKWKTGREGGETLEIVIAIGNAWSEHTRNPSCEPASPRCTASCPDWGGTCVNTRTCVDEVCNSYLNMRNLDTCLCYNSCGDAQCRCEETCNSCPADCGECPKPPAQCPNGAGYQLAVDEACTAANGCLGKRSRECVEGTWGAWSPCLTVLEKCGDGSCLSDCPTTTTNYYPTTQPPTSTTTTNVYPTTTTPPHPPEDLTNVLILVFVAVVAVAGAYLIFVRRQ